LEGRRPGDHPGDGELGAGHLHPRLLRDRHSALMADLDSVEAEGRVPTQKAERPIIQVIGLHKYFGDHHVLRGIDLVVPKGSTLVILGGSGSGKTVMMKHLIGLLKPDKGEVFVDGEDLVPLGAEDLARVRRKFGMVFQAAALFDSMTVFENVSFPLQEHTKMSEEQMRQIVKDKLGI